MISDLAPILTPHWTHVPGVGEVTAWPLQWTEHSFAVGSARTARAYADALGARLLTSAEVDMLWLHCQAYGCCIEPPTAKCPSDPVEQSGRILRLLNARGVSRETVITNTGKPWLADTPVRPGHAVIYGWHVAREACRADGTWCGIRTYPARNPEVAKGWRVLQPWSDYHWDHDTACGYETHIQLVKL
jgi:hypothetical protein